jgi:hypothetical protein
MASIYLQLTLTGSLFALKPLPPHVESSCTSDEGCNNPASHRLLLRKSPVKLLCDDHTIEWARDHGCNITSVR